MTPDDQPAPPAGLRPETALICAGRPSHAANEPLNVPVVLASNFHASITAAPDTEEGGRAYARTDATPTWEALETAVGQVEGGHAVAFSSGMAAVAAVLDLVPGGGRVVAPKDCYFGVGELLADGQQQGRWAVDRVDLTDAASVQAAVAGADLLWLETPSNPLLDIADLPALCAAGRRAGASSASTTPSRRHCCNSPWHSARTWSCTAPPNSSAATPTCCPASPSPASRPSPSACATAAACRAQPPERWKPSWRCAACALLPCGSTAASATPANSPAGSMQHPAVSRVRYPGLPGHPGHRTAAAQMTGFGAVLAFEVTDARTADRLCDAVQVIVHATSLGGVETTIERRSKLPGQEHLPPGLLRLSVGCEHVDDLWNDLNSAIEQASIG